METFCRSCMLGKISKFVACIVSLCVGVSALSISFTFKVTNSLFQRRRPHKQNFNGSSCFVDPAGPAQGSQLLSIKLHKALLIGCRETSGELVPLLCVLRMWNLQFRTGRSLVLNSIWCQASCDVAHVRSECSLASGASVGPSQIGTSRYASSSASVGVHFCQGLTSCFGDSLRKVSAVRRVAGTVASHEVARGKRHSDAADFSWVCVLGQRQTLGNHPKRHLESLFSGGLSPGSLCRFP